MQERERKLRDIAKSPAKILIGCDERQERQETDELMQEREGWESLLDLIGLMMGIRRSEERKTRRIVIPEQTKGVKIGKHTLERV